MSELKRRWLPWIMALGMATPLAKLFAHTDAFLVWPQAIYSDLLTAHLPLSLFVHQALLRWQQIPLWNPVLFGGQPLIGDPLVGFTYPPMWLTYLWPSALAFQLLFAAHLIWAGIGAFLLGRRFGLRPLAAAVMAVAFAGTPRLWGHWGLGHVTLVFAVTWTPWVLLALESAIAASVERIDGLRFGLAGAVLGILTCADPRWAPPAGALALLYFVWRIAYSHQETKVRLRRIGGFLVLCAGALGASSWLLIPLMRFVSQSTRSGLSAGDAAALSLSPGALLGLVFPDPATWPEQVTAVGVVVFLLACVGLVARSHPGAAFWAGVAVVGWLLGLGQATPIFGGLEALPGMALVRVPARWVMLSSFALSVLAGMGFDAVLREDSSADWQRRIRLLLVAFVAFMALLGSGVAAMLGPIVLVQHPSWLVAIVWTLVAAGALGWRLSRPGSSVLLVLLALLVPVELGLYNWQAVEGRVLPAGSRATGSAPGQDWGDQRLLSTAYILPQLEAVRQEKELAGGVGPLQLKRYWSFLSDALGFDPDAYSVTLPPYPLGDPMMPGELNLPAEELGWLNIGEVAVPQSTHVEGFQPVGPWRGGWLYTNTLVRPRAWLQDATGLEVQEALRPVISIDWEPNRIVVDARGPGRLVLAETVYPGWTATLDGQRVQIEPAAELLRSVALPTGEHEIVFRFLPWDALLGVIITGLTWLALLILWWRR